MALRQIVLALLLICFLPVVIAQPDTAFTESIYVGPCEDFMFGMDSVIQREKSASGIDKFDLPQCSNAGMITQSTFEICPANVNYIWCCHYSESDIVDIETTYQFPPAIGGEVLGELRSQLDDIMNGPDLPPQYDEQAFIDDAITGGAVSDITGRQITSKVYSVYWLPTTVHTSCDWSSPGAMDGICKSGFCIEAPPSQQQSSPDDSAPEFPPYFGIVALLAAILAALFISRSKK